VEPLSAVAFEILLALAEGERHGYAILKDVEARTGGEIRLLPGSLYRAIGRLLAAGLIQEVPGSADTEPDDRRRTYRLTRAGRAAAAAEARRLAGQVEAARSRRLLRGSEGR
jgi:DNA-binding PadR family transcriptional regulator